MISAPISSANVHSPAQYARVRQVAFQLRHPVRKRERGHGHGEAANTTSRAVLYGWVGPVGHARECVRAGGTVREVAPLGVVIAEAHGI